MLFVSSKKDKIMAKGQMRSNKEAKKPKKAAAAKPKAGAIATPLSGGKPSGKR